MFGTTLSEPSRRRFRLVLLLLANNHCPYPLLLKRIQEHAFQFGVAIPLGDGRIRHLRPPVYIWLFNCIVLTHGNDNVTPIQQTLQIANADPLELIAYTFVQNKVMALMLETRYKRRFREYQVKGEWYSLSEQMEETICDISGAKKRPVYMHENIRYSRDFVEGTHRID